LRILIVDDDRAHGESLADLLNSRGHETYFAASGEEAEWLLGLFPFDVAIVDYDMPGLTGLQVVDRLRGMDPRLRAALMSARELTPQRREEAGSIPFIAKPIRPESVLEFIGGPQPSSTSTAVTIRVSFPLLPTPRRGRD
jgi:CheY-like chemotaxis protein